MKMEFATSRPMGCSDRRWCSRPPAMRTSLSGFISRIRLRIFRHRAGVSDQRSASGVPGMGMRKFTGIESTPMRRSSSATSTMSSSVSPMPNSAPQHGDSPCSFTTPTVWTRSAYVWVEQMSP